MYLVELIQSNNIECYGFRILHLDSFWKFMDQFFFRLLIINAILVMASPVYASTQLFDNSATYYYASSQAQVFWPTGQYKTLAKQNAKRIATFDVADIDKERAIYIPLESILINNEIILLIEGATGDKGVADFLSKEKNAYKAPQLTYEYETNKRLLVAQIDTYIVNKGRKPLSSKPFIKAGRGNISLLRFVFPASVELAKVKNLRLMLTTTNRQYGKSKLEIAQINYTQKPIEIEQDGLASGYILDKGINEHPSVYHFDDFDQQGWLSKVKTSVGLTEPVWQNTGELIYVEHSKIGHFSGQQGKSVKMPFRTSKNLAGNLDYYFASQTGGEPEEAYFRYYSLLGSGAYASGGGKLPGFGGTYNKAGWGGRANNGKNGWSARGAFFQTVGSKNQTWGGRMPIGSYIYEVDTKNKYGKSIPWGHELSTQQPGRWYAIEQYLKLNTPGQKDGVLTVWIDGKRIYNRNNMHFRDTDQLKIEKVWLNYYFGGVAKPNKNFDMYIDNIVIASEYIGPARK